ncbi:hypothetical protein Hypma_007582 [Hypsizygus marmoreus]|uniref:Uncharacterized protein n=1 Tax=Hypsizygus marmoreus TaxID=39966 RepID=A0A369JZF9_HYPMA|nr:hypothetical protein Hypma_007582 [Hypsizygus marmoreus]
MSKDDDLVPAKYAYSWSSESDLSLQDFLTKYKPSMVQNDGTKPWIWVRGSEPTKQDSDESEATEEASRLLKEVTDRVEAIKNDASIPMRSSKKTGAKSKKEVREQVQADATEKLKEIAIKHGYVSGKWLIFAPAEKIDMIWSGIATSLVAGPLASTSAYLAKVATSSEQENPHHQHLICVYLPDVYDKEKVTEVMKILLRNHGVNLSGVKCNLYTTIGIDSKHASGISSTIWKNSALLSEKESKELKDSFFADLAPKKAVASEAPQYTDAKEDAASAVAPSKPKPKLKKKVINDPFASDNDNEDEEEEKPKQEVQGKTIGKAKPKPKKKAADDGFTSDNNEDAQAKRRKEEVKAKKSSSTSKRKQDSDDGDDDEEDRPKKRRSGRAIK